MIFLLDFLFFLSAFRLMWKNASHNFGEIYNEHYYQRYYYGNILLFLIESYYIFLIHIQIILCSMIVLFLPEDKQLIFLIISAIPELLYSMAERFVIWYKKEIY